MYLCNISIVFENKELREKTSHLIISNKYYMIKCKKVIDKAKFSILGMKIKYKYIKDILSWEDLYIRKLEI